MLSNCFFLTCGTYSFKSPFLFSLSYILSFPGHVFQSFIHSCSSSGCLAYKLTAMEMYVLYICSACQESWMIFSLFLQILSVLILFFPWQSSGPRMACSVSTRHIKPWFFSDSHISDYLVFLLHLNDAIAISYDSSCLIMMSYGSQLKKYPLSKYFTFCDQISDFILNFLIIGQYLLSINILTDHNSTIFLDFINKVLHK